MVKWIVQNNLIKQKVLDEFRTAFSELNIEFEEVKMIPFSNELPPFHPSEQNVFYGSTTLMMNAAKHPVYKSGVFYDAGHFTTENYLQQWGSDMLNHDGVILSFKDFMENELAKKEQWFLRPDADNKSFAGGLMSSNEIKEWYQKILKIDNPDLNAETLVFASGPKTITREWRNFIVNGKVVSSARYVLHGNLAPSTEDVPEKMIEFTTQCASQYAPHTIFVMDVAETTEGFKIIECNCFNGTGFYGHDIKAIVKSITNHLKTLE